MEEAIFHKFTQPPDLLAELLATGDAELVEVSLLSIKIYSTAQGNCRILTKMPSGELERMVEAVMNSGRLSKG